MNRVNLLGLATCLGMLLGLSACGGSDSPSGNGSAQSQEPVPPPGLPASDEAKPAPTGVEQGSAAISAAQMAQPCLSCHSIDNFAGMDAAALEASMQAMKKGEIAHLPLPDSLSDQDLADIAAYLAEAAG